MGASATRSPRLASCDVRRTSVIVAHDVGGVKAGEHRDGVQIVVRDTTGACATVEALPWPSLHTLEGGALALAVERAAAPLVDAPCAVHSLDDARALALRLGDAAPLVSSTLVAALVALSSARTGASPAILLGARASAVETATLIAREEALERVDARVFDARVIKVKVHGKDDVGRVFDVHARAPHAALRIDANRSLTLDHALALAERLRTLPIAFFEEPVAQDALAAFRAAGHALALDESLASTGADALDDDDVRALSPAALVVKPSVLGAARALELVARAQQGTLAAPLVVSAAFETRGVRAIWAALHAASASPVAAGLGTGRFLDEEPLAGEPLAIAFGEMRGRHA